MHACANRGMHVRTIETGEAVTRIMSVRQPVFSERRLSNGGKAETLITLFHSNDEGSQSFVS